MPPLVATKQPPNSPPNRPPNSHQTATRCLLQKFPLERTHADSLPTRLDVCHQVFPNAYQQQQHRKTHYKCTECSETYITVYQLNIHLKTHFRCVTCKESFTSKAKLEQHMSTHPRCPVCNQVYNEDQRREELEEEVTTGEEGSI